MSDVHNIDSHKLIYHPRRVTEWLNARHKWETAKSVYPIYVELSPMGACNHRCTFCSVDYIGYQTRQLDPGMLKSRLTEMARLGIKSVMFAGEGEPSLWKPLPEVLEHCTSIGIDTSMTTNMVPFSEHNTDAIIRNCAWVKTSINAGTAKTYSEIHQTKEQDFDRVLDNFRRAVRIRNDNQYNCTIGGQMVLLPENAHEAYTLGETLRDIGVDYLVVKPYTQSLSGISHKYEGLSYEQFSELDDQLTGLNNANFTVVYRKRTMAKLQEEKRLYQTCQATPFFWAYVMADGSLYGCSAYLQDERFCYGNLNESSFKDLWEGKRRRANYFFVRDKLDISSCRVNCRMDDINRYLWQFDHPDPHVNFI